MEEESVSELCESFGIFWEKGRDASSRIKVGEALGRGGGMMGEAVGEPREGKNGSWAQLQRQSLHDKNTSITT